jgi:arylsulfatase A-like enzyme
MMLKPSEQWLKTHTDEPFMAEYFTGTGHYGYECLGTRYGDKDFSEDDQLNRYLNCLRLQDIFLKNLFDQYKELGLYENTIFVLFGDHGEGFKEHGRDMHGEGNDNIRPMAGDDTVYAYGGDDEVGHSGGKDTIYGGPGADTLRGGFGDDHIYDYDGTKDSTGAFVHDDAHDLLDCAYLTSRGDTGENDVGYGAEKTDPFPDTVVDCSNRDDQ